MDTSSHGEGIAANNNLNLSNLEQTRSDDDLEINEVIDCCLHRVLDIEDCAREYIPTARQSYNNNAERLKQELTDAVELLEEEKDQNKRLIQIKNLRKALRDLDRHNSSSPVATLEKSLFINLFACFDKFIGDIVAALYKYNPELYKNIHREIPLSEALQFESIEDLRRTILEKEIESLKRKSYVEQFKDLEGRFSLTLTKFDEWANFVECAQRRNLFTHCDGIVSKQYLDICRQAGVKFDEKFSVGDQLKIGAKYFFKSSSLIAQVAIMLGQTLWRKHLSDDIEKADRHLNRLVFDFLHMEHWRNAISLSKFALGLPKISNDEIERILTVNYAIALKAKGKDAAAKQVLNKKDWSATTYDFKLAYAILTDNYNVAKEIMLKIGKKGELISELSYHDWPLFRDFRDSSEFYSGYEEIYGYKYSSKLSELANEKKIEIDEVSSE